jgi:signal transduction histidine kinase
VGAKDDTIKLEDLQHLVVRLSHLVEISVTLNSTLDRDRLLQFIVDSAADLLDSQEASIMLLDEHSNALRVAASTSGSTQPPVDSIIPLEGSLAGNILLEDNPVILNEITGALGISQGVDPAQTELRSLIGVPLRIRDQVTGVLQASNKRQGLYDETDLRTLSNIASQAAVALNNARLVDALQRAYNELDKLDRLKSDFIAIASHELRTPLGLILGYAALLKDEAGDMLSDHAEAVLNSALRMQGLIEDMTNMDMLQLGSAEFSLAPAPLAPVIEAACNQIASLVEAKGQQLHVSIPPTPIMLNLDKDKLGMAINNLLNNAMRFTASGGNIWLEVSSNRSEVWIRVRDDGMGLSQKELERIFQKFYQVEDHMRRSHEGLGLGLAIVKAVADGHKGRVWAESEGLGTGCTFTIALPRA